MNYHKSLPHNVMALPFVCVFIYFCVSAWCLYVYSSRISIFSGFFRSATFKCTFITFAQTNFYCRAKEMAQKHKTKLLTDFIVQDEQSLRRVENVHFICTLLICSYKMAYYFLPLSMHGYIFLFK